MTKTEPTFQDTVYAAIRVQLDNPSSTEGEVHQALHEAGFDVYGSDDGEWTPDEPGTLDKWVEAANGWIQEATTAASADWHGE